MKVSNDGKYLAIARRDFEDIDNWHTHFYLYDAQTMKLIRELEDVVSEARTIEFIQFSENSKYVGYGQLHLRGEPKGTFFTCEPPYKKWEYLDKSIDVRAINFIGDEYVILCAYGAASIWNIETETSIFKTFRYGQPTVIPYNKKYNSIITNDKEEQKYDLVSLNFGSIMSTTKEDIHQSFKVNYRNGILSISNYEFVSMNINLSISDISGKILYNQTVLASEQIEIPLNLNTGTYLINLQDGNNSFSDKFLVVE